MRSVIAALSASFGCAIAATAALVAGAASAVTIDWVTVGNPGNACDPQAQGCFGAVAYEYQISKYEVTNAQYAEFLNAVGATDTNGLYSTNMQVSSFGGITRSGSSGTHTYSAIGGRENMPVSFVSFYDALRFANWLQNGQLSGGQDNTTTEDGAYTFTGPESVGERNVGALTFLTSEDEWYKAAYYDATASSFFDYPVGSDVQPTCATVGPAANTANCGNVVGDFTEVGSYTGSPSPSSTFDQSGNAGEWTEALIPASGRGLRGGDFFFGAGDSAASFRDFVDPANEDNDVGFRVATCVAACAPVPEPGTGLLVLTGLLGLVVRRTLSP